MNKKYTIKLLKGNMKIRQDHGVQKNGVDIDSIATLTANTYAEGFETWEPTLEDLDNYLNCQIGDQWLHLNKPKNGWVAIRHNGEDLCKLIEIETPGEVTLTHTIEVFSDGSIKIDGLPYP